MKPYSALTASRPADLGLGSLSLSSGSPWSTPLSPSPYSSLTASRPLGSGHGGGVQPMRPSPHYRTQRDTPYALVDIVPPPEGGYGAGSGIPDPRARPAWMDGF